MWISKKELDVMKLEEYEKGYDKGYEDGLEEGNPFFRIGIEKNLIKVGHFKEYGGIR